MKVKGCERHIDKDCQFVCPSKCEMTLKSSAQSHILLNSVPFLVASQGVTLFQMVSQGQSRIWKDEANRCNESIKWGLKAQPTEAVGVQLIEIEHAYQYLYIASYVYLLDFEMHLL